MGLFNLFQRKAAEPAPATPTAAAPPSPGGRRPELPTVKPGPELFDAYATAFREEVGKLGFLSSKDMVAALAFVIEGDGGVLNQGRYHRALFERYFRDADWRWPEFEEWHAIGAMVGRWPVQWGHAGMMCYTDARAIGPEAIASYRWSTYGLLMRHIFGRAGAAGQRARFAKLGIEQWQVSDVYKEDREFVDLALAARPEAIPPLFPGDLSYVKPILPFMIKQPKA